MVSVVFSHDTMARWFLMSALEEVQLEKTRKGCAITTRLVLAALSWACADNTAMADIRLMTTKPLDSCKVRAAEL